MEWLADPVSVNRTERRTLNDRINQLHKEYALKTATDFTSDEEHPRKKVRWGNRVVINNPEGSEDTSEKEEDVPEEDVIRDDEEELEEKYDCED
jgi:hypothetical protein